MATSPTTKKPKLAVPTSTPHGAYVGSLDQGTTSTRFIVFDRRGETIASAQHEHTQIMPSAGRVEHDPEEIWRQTCRVMTEAMQQANLKPSDLSAIGITNQRETTVLWDHETGAPLGNAVVWMDTRSESVCKRLAAESPELGRERFRAKTGLPLTAYFSGTKIKWILENNPAARAALDRGTCRAGTIDAWLCYKLSGGTHHITDVTNASRYLLMNIHTLEWDSELCDAVGVPISVLPTIRSSSEPYFRAVAPACVAGVTVSGILGDQQSALVGQAAFRPGDAKNTYGTGLFMLLNTGDRVVPSAHGLLTTVAYQLGPRATPVYALEGSVAIGGALIQWLRDNLGLIQKASEVGALARQVEDNGGVYFVPAFSGLYAPYWNPTARGCVLGLTRFVTKHHLARAALEATAYQTLDVFEAMIKDSGVALKSLRVDGGMAVEEILMQFQADVADCPVERPLVTETTALGAAYAAGLAMGVWTSLEDVAASWPGVAKTFQPSMTEEKRSRLKRRWKKAVESPSAGSRRRRRRRSVCKMSMESAARDSWLFLLGFSGFVSLEWSEGLILNHGARTVEDSEASAATLPTRMTVGRPHQFSIFLSLMQSCSSINLNFFTSFHFAVNIVFRSSSKRYQGSRRPTQLRPLLASDAPSSKFERLRAAQSAAALELSCIRKRARNRDR